MDLLLEVLPIEDMGEPGEASADIEEDLGQLPGPAEGVDEEDVPGQGDQGVIDHVGVLKVDGRVLDVVAGVDQEFTITVEFKGLRWLVHLICAFQILGRTLSELSLCCPYDLVQILNLAEASLWLCYKCCLLLSEGGKSGMTSEKRTMAREGR